MKHTITIKVDGPELDEQQQAEACVEMTRAALAAISSVSGETAPDTLPEGATKWKQS